MLLSRLQNDPSTHDVTFVTSNNGRVTAHRAVVAAASPVLHAMLYGSMKESIDKEIVLPSVDTDTLECSLSFIYTGKLEVNSDNCYKILEAANYFNIDMLESRCVDFIVTLLSSENCCSIACFAAEKSIDSLLEKCNRYMKNSFFHISKIVCTPEFKHLPLQSIIEICNSSDIYIKEIDLFLAIKEWVSNQSLLPKDAKEKIFKLIRYPLISSTDLIEKVGPTELVDPSIFKVALQYRLSSRKRFKGLQDQIKLRQYFFDFHLLYSSGMFIKQDAKGTLITKRKGLSCVCFSNVFDTHTQSNPIKFRVSIIKHHLEDSSKDDDIELLLGYKCISSNYARIPIGDLPIHQDYDGLILSTDTHLELELDAHRKAITAIRHDGAVKTLAVCMTKTGDQVRITKM